MILGTVFNSFASGQMNGMAANTEFVLGGLVGVNLGVILDSVASINIVENGKKGKLGVLLAGGLVGANGGVMENSYATGSISMTGNMDTSQSGGLVAWIGEGGVVRNCYAMTAVSSGQSSDAGGLAGQTDVPITASYSTGTVTAGGNSTVGGFVGYDSSNGGLSDDDWNTTTSGITNLSRGAGNVANDPGITGETTAQLQSGLPAGFDPTIWAQSPSINNGFPYLINNPPQ
jgi:hypothetical protein